MAMAIARPSITNKRKEKTMDQKTNRDCAKNLLYWIRSLAYVESEDRNNAHLYFEINPFNGDGDVCESEQESIQELTFADIRWMTESLAAERSDVFQVDTLSFKYDGDFEEGIIKVSADIHLSE